MKMFPWREKVCRNIKILPKICAWTNIFCQVIVTVGFVYNPHQYSGVLYQVMCDYCKKKKRKVVTEVLAAGGRYDKLVFHNGCHFTSSFVFCLSKALFYFFNFLLLIHTISLSLSLSVSLSASALSLALSYTISNIPSCPRLLFLFYDKTVILSTSWSFRIIMQLKV